MKLMLDTNILLKLCHPTRNEEVQEWLLSLLQRGADAPEILVSVLADYELRRTLLQRGADAARARLDDLARSFTYVPVTAETVRRAAEISARLAADGHRRVSDVDSLMAAQAQAEGAILVTTDRDFRDVPGLVAKDWTEIE